MDLKSFFENEYYLKDKSNVYFLKYNKEFYFYYLCTK